MRVWKVYRFRRQLGRVPGTFFPLPDFHRERRTVCACASSRMHPWHPRVFVWIMRRGKNVTANKYTVGRRYFFSLSLSLFFFKRAPSGRVYTLRLWNVMKRLAALLRSSSFFLSFSFLKRERETERDSLGALSRCTRASAIVAGGCIIALIKRYILWTRYNSGTKPCVPLHDKGENWQACWCSCCHGWRWMGHSRGTKELRIGETRVELIKSLCAFKCLGKNLLSGKTAYFCRRWTRTMSNNA